MGTWETFLALPADQQTSEGMEALREVVAEAGSGYVFEGTCEYVREGEPACIIGRAAHKLGAPITLLSDWDSLVDSVIARVVEELEYTIAEPLVIAWEIAQARQDERSKWGVALGDAEEALAAALSNA